MQDLGQWPEGVSGEVYAGCQEKVLHTEGVWALDQAPQKMGTAPNLTESKKSFDWILRHTV